MTESDWFPQWAHNRLAQIGAARNQAFLTHMNQCLVRMRQKIDEQLNDFTADLADRIVDNDRNAHR